MEVLDLLLDSARRHVRHDEEDVREWARAAPPADDGALLRARITAVADRMRATFAELVETEKHHQEVARRGAWSEKTLRQIQDTARRQATNAAELLGLVARLPEPARPSAEVRADLEMLRFEADELAEVMDGEIQYWRGDKLTPWSTVLAEMYGQAEPEALARVTPMFVMARAGSQS